MVTIPTQRTKLGEGEKRDTKGKGKALEIVEDEDES
jgi:hypothetical protein